MNSIRFTAVVLFALTPLAAQEQPSAGLPPPNLELKVREGKLASKPRPARAHLVNRAALDKLKLLPPGYSYTQEGKTEGRTYHVSRMELRSPTGDTQILLARHEGSLTLHREARLLGSTGSEVREVVSDPTQRLMQLLEEDVDVHGTGRYTARGWTVDVTRDRETKRLYLVDHVRCTSGSRQGWAVGLQLVGKKQRQRVLITYPGVQIATARRAVTLLRSAAPAVGLSEKVAPQK